MVVEISPSNHPLTPPLTEEEWLSWLRLLRSRRVGVATFFRLMEEHGSAAAALDALPSVARKAGEDDYRPATRDAAARELDAARLAGVLPVAFGAPGYPAALAEISDPPPILWTLGDAELLKRPAVAIVGARNASSLGTRMARRLAGELGRDGIVIVSGLARGIDTAAHAAALETGTIAVMAGGVDVVYPTENAALAQEIAEKGLRLSEMPMHLQPQARHFPRRNRIVAGLARAVIVVEAAAKSGSLITARDAADEGRDVMAVPGHPFDARAAGTNMLIRDGATLVRGARDVAEVLATSPVTADSVEPAAEPARNRTEASAPSRDTATLHSMILDRLGSSPIHEDQLLRDLGASGSALGPELVALELDGRIRRDPGGLLSRAH